MTSTPAIAITGDFILATGPESIRWLQGLRDFQVTELAPGVAMAQRGPVIANNLQGGGVQLALADLIQGDLDASLRRPYAAVQRSWRGRFALASWTPGNGLEGVTDHLDSLPLYWYRKHGHTAIATDLRLLLNAPGVEREPDLLAVFHYLNFQIIPAPTTICRDVRRMEPGSHLVLDTQSARNERWYIPEYAEDLRGSDAQLAGQLRDQIVDDVRAYRPSGQLDWGCFLSGGTDSSSIVSILAQQPGVTGKRVQTCSIGFDEDGYDELEFARIASEACGAQPHLDKVDRHRAMALQEAVLAAYDQPNGNASAIPTLAVAELGRKLGFSIMLGGDGGDEIFGGNQRYAKDKVMEGFYGLPSPLKAAARAIGRTVGGGRNFTLNRVRNFTERASLPNPDRFYTDDSFASDFYDELLTDTFRSRVPQHASRDFMRDIYANGGHAEPLHRIMRLDLQMAIAQNDLVKVHRACKHYDIAARFPYTDPDLIAWTGRLPARYKVRGLNKRHLFKIAMQDILPQAILKKPKQGFGLPIAVWIKEDPVMKAQVQDILTDSRTRQRGWIKPEFVHRLIELHMSGAWDHSAAIWQLLMLELWMRRYFDAA